MVPVVFQPGKLTLVSAGSSQEGESLGNIYFSFSLFKAGGRFVSRGKEALISKENRKKKQSNGAK